MNKTNTYTSLALAFSFTLQATAAQDNLSNQSKSSHYEENKSQGTVQEKFNLIKRDENSGTDALAIPFDDSEVEDEEQIDRLNKRDLFDLPQAK